VVSVGVRPLEAPGWINMWRRDGPSLQIGGAPISTCQELNSI
jgi:hypothetical protein